MAQPLATRLHVEDDLFPAASLTVSADQAHYLKSVLRLQPGAEIALFNGRDGEWAAEIATFPRRAATLRVGAQTRPQSAAPDIWLAFAPIKRAPVDFLARKATELGASLLWPVITRRTVASRINLDRLRANSIEAAEQTGRLSLPRIRAPASLDEMLADWPAGRTLFCCDETGAGMPALDAFRDHTPAGAGASNGAGLLIGPEGGFAPEELDRLDNHLNVCRIGLGPRILRADTAALAALACWQAVAGDWSPDTSSADTSSESHSASASRPPLPSP